MSGIDWGFEEDLNPVAACKAIIMDKLQQGSTEWLNERIGNVTMSNAKSLIAGGQGKMRQTYIESVASEIITGSCGDNYKSYDMMRGNVLEDYARKAYEISTGDTIKEIGLGYLNKAKRISASPDGLVFDGGEIKKGVEIKCLKPKNHIQFILAQKDPKEFMAQMQGCMWIFGVDEWDFVSYCPEFGGSALAIISAKRDEAMIKKISTAALSAVTEIDKIVVIARAINNNKIHKINVDALEAIDLIFDGGTGEIE